MADGWIEEYEHLMFGPNHSETTMNQAAEIKLKFMPDILYKYRACSEYTFAALEGDFLYSAQPSEFNDIFEGAIEIVDDKAKQNINRKVYDSLRVKYPYLVDCSICTFRDILENIALSLGGTYQEIKDSPLLFPIMTAMEEVALQIQRNMIANMQHYARNMYNILCFLRLITVKPCGHIMLIVIKVFVLDMI